MRSQGTTGSLPELLAPAGDWDCARAAVENGADAIYFGLGQFNARMRAPNFTEADLPRLMDYLHRRGVRGYVCFNTLVFPGELAQAERSLRAVIAAGVDAAIVQDAGVCRLVRRISPDFPIHASTQMSIGSAAGVEFAHELGCAMVTLARELSLAEIERLQQQAASRGAGEQRGSGAVGQEAGGRRQGAGGRGQESGVSGQEPRITNHASRFTFHVSRPMHEVPVIQHPGPPPTPLPLEVFIHGALCLSYSGQCLASLSLGGRSANRGVCAQPCRLPYQLVRDGQVVDLGKRRYLLSPPDLAGLEVLPELARLGVRMLKIEGRLKAPEYVAAVTRVYRAALDRLADVEAHGAGREESPSREAQGGSRADSRNDRYELEMAFSRGLSTGWFRGANHREFIHAEYGASRGVCLGVVSRVQRQKVFARLGGPLKPGDGVVFEAGGRGRKKARGARSGTRLDGPGQRQAEEGGRVYLVEQHGGEAALSFARGALNLHRVQVGARVWKTSDPELEGRVRQSFGSGPPRYQRPISLLVRGRAGEPLSLVAGDGLGHTVRLDSAMPLVRAERQPLTAERLREQLGRLGGTPFKLGALDNQLQGKVLLPLRELNRLRREVVARLEALRAQPRRWTINQTTPTISHSPESALASGAPGPTPASPQLVVLARSRRQLEAALRCQPRIVYWEFADASQCGQALRQFRAIQSQTANLNSQLSTLNPQLFLAPPRVTKPGEEPLLERLRAAESDGFLARNYDHLKSFSGRPCVGDFSLNVANQLSAEYFVRRYGLARVTASLDLDEAQLEALLQAVPPAWIEVVVHAHVPMFHTEHCLFCAWLSAGSGPANCGRPCERHTIKLRDRMGAEHPVRADAACRNTVFNGLAQTRAEHVARLVNLGARWFRVELLDETAEEVGRILECYARLLRGEATGKQLRQELRLRQRLGFTTNRIL